MKRAAMAFTLMGSILLAGCGMEMIIATEFTLSVETPEAPLVVEQGGSERITVNVNRILPINVSPFPVMVTLVEPAPEGVRSNGVTISPGASSSEMVIEVDEDAAPRGPISVKVIGTGMLPVAILPKEATFELVIAERTAP